MIEQHVFGVKGSYKKRSLEEQRSLFLKVKKCKEEYLVELESSKIKTHWDSKRKRHFRIYQNKDIYQKQCEILMQT